MDIEKLKLEKGSKPTRLDLGGNPILAGEVSGRFVPAEPFTFFAH